MKRLVINIFFGASLFISILGFLSASFTIGNMSHSIDRTYGPGNNIRGWINLSFENEPSSSIFKDSLGNSISLIEMINKNTGFNYNCSTEKCVSDYLATNGVAEKSFSLGPKQSKLLGFKINGDIIAINSADFIAESDAFVSCYNQLEIDLLNDGIIDFGNNKISGVDCSFLKNYGCFDESQEIYEVTISPVPFCQRVSLFESPGFKLGAWIKEESMGNKRLTLSLYDLSGGLKKSCELQKTNISGGKEISCNIEYLVTDSRDYYVCISSDQGTGVYKTKGYSGASNCGFNGIPVKTETNSYKIFIEGMGFDSVGALNISNSLQDGRTLSEEISNYIVETYGSFDCSKGCIVPFRLISGNNQQIKLKNLKIVHDKPGLPGIIEKMFYDLEEVPAKISSGFQKISINEAGFKVPLTYGNITLRLNFNDKTIFSEGVVVGNVPVIKSITPSETASAFPTSFKVVVDSLEKITKYEWGFGDGGALTTSVDQAEHTYASSGQYAISINVTDLQGRMTSKKFFINVKSPEELIEKIVKEKKEHLNNVKKQIKSFDSFHQEGLDSTLNLEFLEEELETMEIRYGNAIYEEDYNQILTDLLRIEVPESTNIIKSTSSISFYPKPENIDLYILEGIGGKDYNLSDEEEYINAIFSWNHENLDTKITFKEISVNYDSSKEIFLRFFEVTMNEKKSLSTNPYFIIKKIDNIKFRENYLEKEESGYISIELTRPQTIEFFTTEDVDFTDLPLFISPELGKLELIRPSYNEEKALVSWVLFISVIFLLFIFGFIVYIVLQTWYKNKYEKHLFGNRNDLYNLVTYIQNERKMGVKDNEIHNKLKKSGWNVEQIKYALKKHAGRRTGMIEIPIYKILNFFKKEKKSNVSTSRSFGRNSNQKPRY